MSDWGRYTIDMMRAARRFRQQIWSPRNPKRRIHRVYRCVNERMCKTGDTQTEAHHLDYRKPYRVVWVCRSCHRSIEAGSLKIHPWWIHDYTSLVRPVPVRHRKGTVVVSKPKEKEEVPF